MTNKEKGNRTIYRLYEKFLECQIEGVCILVQNGSIDLRLFQFWL